MTNRPSSHDQKAKAKRGGITGFSRYNVCDSFSCPAVHSSLSGRQDKEGRRLSKKQLASLDTVLTQKDKQVLLYIQRHRYLLSSQVQRLIFTDSTTPSAALRATNRCLKKLREAGLVDNLTRRIGGIRAGSGSAICYLTHAGERFLRFGGYQTSPCRRFFEPSPYFLAHTLAIAEIAIQISEICRESQLELVLLQPEPECWRTYSEHGVQVSLKPDFYAATVAGEYEDRWFFEVDLDTESPAKVIEKCRKYHQYYRSGLEQKESGVFPLTVWIVPGESRKQHLLSHIRSAFDKQPRLFTVITDKELVGLIRYGGNEEDLC